MDSLLDMDKKNLVNLVSLKNEEIKALEEQIKVLKNRIRKRNRSIRRVTTLALERKRKIETLETNSSTSAIDDVFSALLAITILNCWPLGIGTAAVFQPLS
mgnify:CR=1 FL=1